MSCRPRRGPRPAARSAVPIASRSRTCGQIADPRLVLPAASGADRPAGFADRIEIRFDPDVDVEATISEVSAGPADLLALASPFSRFFRRCRACASAHGGLPRPAGGAPAASDRLEYSSTCCDARFDDLRVRRALNYATEHAGGTWPSEGFPRSPRATCQVVPAGMPGYATYCPYTAGDGPGRPWTAPDLVEHAHSSPRPAGTAGARGHGPRVPAPCRTLLRDAARGSRLPGVPPRPQVVRYFDAVYDAAHPDADGLHGWNLDYVQRLELRPSSSFTCASPRPSDVNVTTRPLLRSAARSPRRPRSASDAADAWAPADADRRAWRPLCR